MIYSGTYSTVKASFNALATGLAGTAGVQILDADGLVIKARSTSGITEQPATSGIYFVSIDLTALSQAPAPGHYYLLWDNGAVTPGNCQMEDLMLHNTLELGTLLRTLEAGMISRNAENVAVGVFIP